MKTLLLLIILVMPSIQPARAGGGMTGGATEVTQIMNNVQLAESYAQQVMQYENQLLQYQTMLKNLAANPMGNITPSLNYLISNQARVISGSRDIGNTMSRVDQDFADKFGSPLAGSFSDRFRSWTDHSNGGLKAAMLNAGVQRENFANDEAALGALVRKSQAAEGNLGAIQALGDINAAQLQESMKLRDLISQQQIAQNTYLASQNAKAQEVQDMNDAVGKSTPAPGPLVIPRRGQYRY